MADSMEVTGGTETNLSTWAGPYVTQMLGQTQALGPATYDASGKLVGGRPFQAYGAEQAKAYGDIAKGLVAGPSALQQQAFQGLAGLTVPQSLGTAATQAKDIYKGAATYMPKEIGTIESYMNPYLQAALQPQIRSAQEQAEQQRMATAGRLAQAGAYGGSRQAIMEAEGQKNLAQLLSDITGKGYASAFDAAQKQRMADIEAGRQGLASQTAATQALANIGGQEATYGLQNLQQQMAGGQTQRQAEQEALTAAYNQFLREEQYPQQQLEFLRQMISGLPVASASYYQPAPSAFQSAAGGTATALELLKLLGAIK